MTVDGETRFDIGLRECLFYVLDGGGESAAFVGGERNDGLSVQVDVTEQGEHHLRIGTPPDGAADEDGVVLGKVWCLTLVRRRFTSGLR